MNPTRDHPNIEILRTVYEDLTRLGKFCSDDIVLHAAAPGPGDARCVGKASVMEKERELIRLTGDTLVMDVQGIIANDHFGAVIGLLRAGGDGTAIAMPFCGLWRFRDGVLVEHWENAYDASELTRFLINRSQPESV